MPKRLKKPLKKSELITPTFPKKPEPLKQTMKKVNLAIWLMTSSFISDQQDQPVQIDPDQRGEHEGKACVDRHHLRGVGDEGGKDLAHQGPQHA